MYKNESRFDVQLRTEVQWENIFSSIAYLWIENTRPCPSHIYIFFQQRAVWRSVRWGIGIAIGKIIWKLSDSMEDWMSERNGPENFRSFLMSCGLPISLSYLTSLLGIMFVSEPASFLSFPGPLCSPGLWDPFYFYSYLIPFLTPSLPLPCALTPKSSPVLSFWY